MTALQLCALVLTAVAGTAVALAPSPLRQTLLLSVYGFALTTLFFAFKAPDVALSELVVSGLGLPVIILAALRRLADQRSQEGARGENDSEAESGADTTDRQR